MEMVIDNWVRGQVKREYKRMLGIDIPDKDMNDAVKVYLEYLKELPCHECGCEKRGKCS